MTKSTQLNKICIICGVQKPLAAFLQMTGAQGTMYGNACSTCRGVNAKPNETVIISDDDRSTSSGLRIDADAKNLAELLDKQHDKDREELKLEDAKKKEKLAKQKTERSEFIEKAEKDHRQNYIEAKKKSSFLSFQEKKTPQDTATFSAKKAQETRSFIQTQQHTLEKQKTEEALKEELLSTTLDMNAPILGIRGDEERYKSAVFKSFQSWLGTSAPIAKVLNQLNAKPNNPENAAKDAPLEFTNKSWPSSRKR